MRPLFVKLDSKFCGTAFEYMERYMLKALCEARPIGVIEPSTWWTEEFLDWAEKEDLKRPRARHSSAGWSWLRGDVAEGVLIGGCLGRPQGTTMMYGAV